MPEGPEVKVLVNYLNKKLKNQILEDIEILSGKYQRATTKSTTIDNFEKFRDSLPLKIEKIECKGKFIYFSFSNGWYMFCSLGMKGRFLDYDNKHNRVKFVTNKTTMYFSDQRNFGVINFYDEKKLLEDKLSKKLGIDLLSTKKTDREIFNFIKDKLKKIRSQAELIGDKLLDQKIFSGVGNYIRADALYLSKLSPFTQLKNLSDEQLKLLIKNLQKIMKKSYNDQNKCLQKNKYVYENIAICYHPLVYFQKETKKGEKVMKKKMKYQKRTIWWAPDAIVYTKDDLKNI